jgi:hypothetical protein
MMDREGTVRNLASHVDNERLWRRLMELAQIGATSKGVNRQALSDEDVQARAELVRWGTAIGLEPYVDPAANLFLRLAGADPALPPVLVGSHIDSQPTGGKFDGAFGAGKVTGLRGKPRVLGDHQRLDNSRTNHRHDASIAVQSPAVQEICTRAAGQ